MKRALVFLRLISHGKVQEKALPETLINEEIVRLTKRTPRTQAEKAFHDWLLQWRVQNKERGNHGKTT